DGAGNIYIADAGNNRVLEFAKAGNPPAASDAIANRSYGQSGVSDFSDTQCADSVGQDAPPSNHAMCNPGGVAIDAAGNLFVADSNNDRVVKYAAPFGSGAAAAMVIGQGDDDNFTTAGCDRGIAPGDLFGLGADSLCAPAAVA